MKSKIETLTSELLKLSNRDRLEIAKFLLFLDNRKSNSINVEADWENELIDRINAIDKGTAVGIDYSDAMDRINKRYSL